MTRERDGPKPPDDPVPSATTPDKDIGAALDGYFRKAPRPAETVEATETTSPDPPDPLP